MLVCTVGTARTMEPRVLKTNEFADNFSDCSRDVSVYSWNRAYNGTPRFENRRVC